MRPYLTDYQKRYVAKLERELALLQSRGKGNSMDAMEIEDIIDGYKLGI